MVTQTIDTDLITTMLQINGLSPLNLRDQISASQVAFLLLPGRHNHEYREREAVRLYQLLALASHSHFLIAGWPYKARVLADLDNSIIGYSVRQEYAENTKEQIEWAMGHFHGEYATLSQVAHVIICTAAWHMPRAYLTMIKSMQLRKRLIVLSALPVYDKDDPAHDFTGFPETGGVLGEMRRIQEYREKGDVATHEEYIEYLGWRLAQ